MFRIDLIRTEGHVSAEDSDLLLIARVQQGDAAAFTVLYRRYLPIVIRRVQYTVPSDDVEDVTQEVFISVMKALPSFEGKSLFSTWLRTLTNRRIAGYYRRRSRRIAATALEPDVMDRQPEPERGISHDEVIVLREALNALPDHYKDVILMRFAEGLPFSDIADQTERSLDATKSLFRRAIAALRDSLKDTHDE